MAELTIALSEDRAARLRELAEQQGTTLDELISSWVDAMTTPTSVPFLTFPGEPHSSLDLIGSLDDLNIEPVHNNREIDRLIAEEAASSHDER